MREIKFRAWHKVDEKWLHGYKPGGEGCHIDGEVIITGSWLSECPGPMDINNVVIEQYTGIKDKNGKEIYEGDIFSTEMESGCNWIVLFENGAWIGKNPFWIKGFDSCGLIARKHLGEIRVMGNIHENPELIIGNR